MQPANPQVVVRAIVCLSFGGVLACAAGLPPVVEEVRQEYKMAAQDAQVRQHASVELYEAEQTISRMEEQWQEEGGGPEVEHLAALAQHRIDIARVEAEEAALEADLQRLGRERDQLRLDARERAATRAQAEVRQARSRAQVATREAEEAARALAQVAAEARELEQEVANLQSREDERGVVFTLGDVLFEFDATDVKPGAERTLQRLSEFLQRYPDRKIVIEGHTDSVGSAGYNRELSALRAQAVAEALVRDGVAPERIETSGLGESAPVASNETAYGRQQNRRVELVLRNARSQTGSTGRTQSRS